MFRVFKVTLVVLLAGCSAAAATQIPRGAARADPTVPDATADVLVDANSREVDRWVAICRGDSMDFLDNRDYCLRIGPWEGYRP
jgi:hypothetical protein